MFLLFLYLVDQSWITVFKCEQSEWAGVGEGLVKRPRFPVHQGQSRVDQVMLCQIWGKHRGVQLSAKLGFIYHESWSNALLIHANEAEMFSFSQIADCVTNKNGSNPAKVQWKFLSGFLSTFILHPHSLSLTSGTAQWSGHSSVHDKQCTIQPRALHGHLDLLDAGVQSSLPGLLSGEDGIALAADLGGRCTHSCCRRCKACGGGGWMDSSRKKDNAGGTKKPKG